MKNKAAIAILAIGICGVAAIGTVSMNDLKAQVIVLESEKAVMQEQMAAMESEKVEIQTQLAELDEKVAQVLETESDLWVEQCIAEIESIGEVAFEDEELIKELEAAYAEMTERQKNMVTNYVELRNARRELDRLIVEQAIEGKYVMLNDDWDGYYEFVPENSERTEGKMLVYASSNAGYEVEEQMPYYIEDDMMLLEGDRVTIYVHNGNLIIEDNICEGEIPDGERFETKLIYDGDTLEFYEDGFAAFTDRPTPETYTYERDGDILTMRNARNTVKLYVYNKKIYYDVLIKK